MIKIESLDIIRQSFTNIADAIRRVTGRNKRYKVSELAGAIDGLSGSLNLLYYYNTEQIEINQTEKSIAMITGSLLEKVDVDGYFYLEFNASEACTISFRFEDNNVAELWSPMTFSIAEGDSTINIPHTYLARAAGNHNFVIKAQCSNGTITVYPRGVYYTISAKLLDDRLIEADLDEVMDLSIKQTEIDESPGEIWAIGTEGGEIVVKSCLYKSQKKITWTPRYSCGEGIAAAIEFPGVWTNKNENYTLITSETPFVFIIDKNKILKVYMNETFTEGIELDTEVSMVSVCQGYNSNTLTESDHGLVVVYIKEGNVYCRQYLYDSTILEYTWQGAQTIYEGGGATFVNIHRLPDYRLGISIKYSAGIKWFITKRNYIEQAIKPEVCKGEISNFITITPLDTNKTSDSLLWSAVQNKFSAGQYHNGFILTFEGDIIFANGTSIHDLERTIQVRIDNVLQDTSAIKSIEVIGGKIIITMMNDILGGKTVSISFMQPFLLLKIYNGAYAQIVQDYEWLLPLPIIEGEVVETIDSQIIPSLNITPSQILTTTLEASTEDVQANISTAFNISPHQILTTTLEADVESVYSQINPSVSVTVLLTGITPI